MPLTELPIDTAMPRIVELLERHRALVVRAEPGAGKTTRVPPALMRAAAFSGGKIVVLEPRRLAARAAARRIADEQGLTLGREVGYQVRFDRVGNDATRLWVVTEGILLRMLQDDPFLEGVAAVVLDEFHERSIHVDMALALCRDVQQNARPDLALLVMSATLDPDAVCRFLGGAPLIDVAGRTFPVETTYVPTLERATIEDRVLRGVREAVDAGRGDILVFLPGVPEIRRVHERLGESRLGDFDILEIFGDMSPEDQDRSFRPSPKRRIILATNIAETSITLPWVDCVVDTGLVRRPRYDPASDLDRLVTEPVSRASADQRAGRAGRVGPGRCFRLGGALEHQQRAAFDPPEIARIDLTAAVLALAEWGVPDPAQFAFFEPPPPAALQRAVHTLRAIGALDREGLTAEGRALARMPLQPRLGRLARVAAQLGAPEWGAAAAAILADRDIVRRDVQLSRRQHVSECDLVDRVAAVLRQGESPFAQHELNSASVQAARQSVKQLVRMLPHSAPSPHPADALRRAVLTAWPDRLCRRRSPGADRAVMVGGSGVRIAPESAVVEHELFVAVDIEAPRPGERAEALVRRATGVERAWVDALGTQVREVVEVDSTSGRVTGARRVCFGDLVLEERQVPPRDPAAIAAALARAASRDPVVALGLDDDDRRAPFDRLRFVRRWMPELELPDPSGEALATALEAVIPGRRSLAELRTVPVDELLGVLLRWPQREALDREAPDRIAVPSGSRIRVDYSDPEAPTVAVRIQEVFGLAETPRLAGGRVNVTLQLLAPNYRPQQVTRDLRSFWANGYQEVRRELRARYPKHAWPDDPWTAPPQARPGRRPPG